MLEISRSWVGRSSGMQGIGRANAAISDDVRIVLDRLDFRWFRVLAWASGSTEKMQPMDDPCLRCGGWLYASLWIRVRKKKRTSAVQAVN